ncbi:flagellar basal body rod protein FlgG [Lysinibacillus piscis]|uniref:Flagellar hook protein FlgE n=1 Tax=Lysinibacillus piscis TaxID=2518931 RepID=A0ABQ5NGJ5_9BACI|nr:flagellar basal body rod protein FlgG [Lysinibacillus sp. KH24]GLC87395.1 flagellar basal body protein [Lysinibacillus sp. KH24]
MLRSMYSGISGLRNFQTKLDVIGNNIANVNTHGFKKGRVIFKDLMSQTQSGASGPTGTLGGVNARQVGLGSQLAAIDTIHSGGSLQSTGRVLDIGIEGEGFFIATGYDANSTGPITPITDLKYTRAGNFYLDKDGFLVNADGRYMLAVTTQQGSSPAQPSWDPTNPDDMGNYQDLTPTGGTAVDPAPVVTSGNDPAAIGDTGYIQIPTNAQQMSIATDGKVTFTGSDGVLYYAGQLVMAKFANPGGLQKDGSNYYIPTANSGEAFYAAGTNDGMGKAVSGTLEMSNVDLSEEFTDMIVAQRGFQANTRIITTSDEILQELVNLKR